MNNSNERMGWDDVLGLMEELKGVARGLLRQEANAGSVKTTGLVLSALRRQKRGDQEWQEVSWSNRREFFGRAHRAMWQALIDHGKARKRRRAISAGNLATEFLAPLVEAGALNLDNLVAFASASPERAEALERAIEDLNEAYPGKQLGLIIEHHCFEKMNQQEVARMLGVDERTVRRHLALAKAHLWKMFCPTPAA